jgi:hypothetical protein
MTSRWQIHDYAPMSNIILALPPTFSPDSSPWKKHSLETKYFADNVYLSLIVMKINSVVLPWLSIHRDSVHLPLSQRATLTRSYCHLWISCRTITCSQAGKRLFSAAQWKSKQPEWTVTASTNFVSLESSGFLCIPAPQTPWSDLFHPGLTSFTYHCFCGANMANKSLSMSYLNQVHHTISCFCTPKILC